MKKNLLKNIEELSDQENMFHLLHVGYVNRITQEIILKEKKNLIPIFIKTIIRNIKKNYLKNRINIIRILGNGITTLNLAHA